MKATKSLWIRILCLTVVVFSLFLLNACNDEAQNCEHEWGEWSVITAASCEADAE